MKINQSEFITSSTKIDQCPKADKPEYAFIGRSNVGKSSLINMLTGRKKLVKVSGSPGKTITINHFLINENWYLVDLPGFGYAKRSKSERAKWEKMIRNYILKRNNLLTVFLLVDARHEPQKLDVDFIEWLGVSQIPFVIVFTKEDKLKKMQLEKNLQVYTKRLSEKWEELPNLFVASSVTGKGKDEILQFISDTNQLFSS
ncbi:MAG: ribosome biogenesis GTP-binding protein YihA/YsxC [Bacteroidales bacterium]|jgi:GTP-binding protein|nr:ribosome biogenesis GTP-binding protein YihA/YsxC [Bacteroidales bacterium]